MQQHHITPSCAHHRESQGKRCQHNSKKMRGKQAKHQNFPRKIILQQLLSIYQRKRAKPRLLS